MIKFDNVTDDIRPIIIAPIFGTDIATVLTMLEIGNRSRADVLEWRVDELQDLSALTDADVQTVLFNSDKPILFTWRTSEEGGAADFDDPQYRRLYQLALQSGVAGIDIEYRLLPAMAELVATAQQAGTTVVTSVHDMSGMPESPTELAVQMHESDADVIKIAVTPRDKTDVDELLALQNAQSIIIGMGEIGQPTRSATETASFGALVDINAPGQLSVDSLVTHFEENKNA
jgi:3-dehydroquinate dehydratase-1